MVLLTVSPPAMPQRLLVVTATYRPPHPTAMGATILPPKPTAEPPKLALPPPQSKTNAPQEKLPPALAVPRPSGTPAGKAPPAKALPVKAQSGAEDEPPPSTDRTRTLKHARQSMRSAPPPRAVPQCSGHASRLQHGFKAVGLANRFHGDASGADHDGGYVAFVDRISDALEEPLTKNPHTLPLTSRMRKVTKPPRKAPHS